MQPAPGFDCVTSLGKSASLGHIFQGKLLLASRFGFGSALPGR